MRTSKAFAKILGGLLAALLITAVGAYEFFTGPQHLDQYPAASASPYRLPYPADRRHLCVQSNRGVVSHRGWERFAYDFAMPVGSDICAARAGEVVKVVMGHDGHGYQWPNNMVVIRHEDGTLASYLHIRKDGSRVAVGDKVAQGQIIAASGHVGNSMLPHVHFHVTDPDRKSTLPISFSDVDRDRGVPRMFKWYKPARTQ